MVPKTVKRFYRTKTILLFEGLKEESKENSNYGLYDNASPWLNCDIINFDKAVKQKKMKIFC